MSKSVNVDSKISQIGNSLGIIIPSIICNSWKLEKGTAMNVKLFSDKIVITKEEK